MSRPPNAVAYVCTMTNGEWIITKIFRGKQIKSNYFKLVLTDCKGLAPASVISLLLCTAIQDIGSFSFVNSVYET